MAWPVWRATTENPVTGGGRTRASGGIVIAGDRTQSRLAAHRHSRRVRMLKIVLPLIAVVMAGIATMNILGNAGVGPSLPPLEVPQIVADNLKMHNPHYQGFNDDGGHYWVKAETAQQDLKTLTAIHLQGITGELTDVKKQKTHLVAHARAVRQQVEYPRTLRLDRCNRRQRPHREADARNRKDEGRHHHLRPAVDDPDGRRHDHVQSIDHSPEEQRIHFRRHCAHAHEAERSPPPLQAIKRRSKRFPSANPENLSMSRRTGSTSTTSRKPLFIRAKSSRHRPERR